MIEMHCHILPMVDDGAKDFDVSLELIKKEIEEDNKIIVLTPHQNKNYLDKELLENRFIELKEKAKDLDCKLYLGSELYYYERFIEDLDNGKIQTMNNSKYVLIEFSTTLETAIADILYDMTIKGYKPIIAHIERYDYLTFDDYKEIAKYALIQVNADAFKNKANKKNLKFLLKNKLVTFIASDCHDLNTRCCDYSVAKKVVMKKYKDQYDKLFNQVPEFIK